MSGIVVYSEYEAKRNEFAVSKFKKYLGAELVTAENLQISAKHDFVINRTNNAKSHATLKISACGYLIRHRSPLLQTISRLAMNLCRATALKLCRLIKRPHPLLKSPQTARAVKACALSKRRI